MKRWMTLVLAFCLALGLHTTAFSATKVGKVEVAFSFDQAPASGDYIGSIRAAVPADAPYKVEFTEYVTDEEMWTVGDRPVVRVELSASEGYYFSSTSKSSFTLSGCDATFKSASRRDSNSTLILEVYLKRIGGKLTGISDIEWNGATAVWEPLYGAKSYEVRLLRNGSTVTTAATQATSYNFAKNISRAGEYTFKVRAISNYNSQAGEWSEDSEIFDVEKEDLETVNNMGNAPGYPSNTPCWNQTGLVGWQFINNQWYYFDANGQRMTGWQFLDGRVFYMDGNGIMQVGWQFINNQWYLFNPVSDGTRGAMTTGWQFVDNRWYYMDANGVMQVGWQFIGGKWYYLNPVSDGTRGAMYANTYTPDGYFVDASGARVG